MVEFDVVSAVSCVMYFFSSEILCYSDWAFKVVATVRWFLKW